jgi:acetyl esterase/lipase
MPTSARIILPMLIVAIATTATATPATAASLPDPARTLQLWPALAEKSPGEIVTGRDDGVLRLTNVENPSIAVYPAPNSAAPSPAVLVCPGGGYAILAYDKEGTEIAQWLNSIGFTAVVLKYRVPDNRTGALADAQRALSLMRHNAAAWNIDSNRIGILGFSAGGHLAAAASTANDTRAYGPIDEADKAPCIPNFTVLIYPAYLGGDDLVLPVEVAVTKDTPPAFILQTQDDSNYINSSLAYYVALKRAGVFAEMHLFPEGGHGYGLRPSEHAVSRWPALCGDWLVRQAAAR